jgi:hypothetical protein
MRFSVVLLRYCEPVLLDRPKFISSISFEANLRQCSWVTSAKLPGSVIVGRQASIKKPSTNARSRADPREIRLRRIRCLVAGEEQSWLPRLDLC